MTRFLAHARLLVLTAAIPLTLATQSRAVGQEPALEVYYTKLEPKDQFKYKWKGKEAVCNVGVFRWEVPQTEFGTNGLDRNFTGYCAEILVPITEDKLYRFRVNSLFEPSNYDGLAGKDNAATAAQKRAIYIQELFGRYFRDPVLKAVNTDEALALQIALWEVIQETEPAEGQPPLKLDLFSGDFQANYPKADAPAYVTKAQEYLDSLTGNDALFYQNPDLRGRELIRLMGIPNANNVVAQSQFALRFAGGGGTGLGNPTGALLGGGLGGLFGPGGGAGFGPGGLAPFLGAGSGGAASPGSTSPASTTPGNGTTTPTTPVNTNPPTTPPITTPPINGPPSNPPTTPVPAPAGLLLGAIAAGTLGAWRVGVRLLTGK